jgi:glutathione peroxidase-family protein/Flp pilus assembly protein TadD
MKKIALFLVAATMMMGVSAQSIYDFEVNDVAGKPVSLSEYKGKVLLIVNTATECGFTPQYKELEPIYERYREKGLEILDFPCNQFGGQAPGTIQEIQEFCSANFDVHFPLFDKVDVNGDDQSPLFKFLKSKKGFEGFDLNDRLASKRQDVSENYVNEQLKATKVDADVDAHYTAEDWDGFQRLVQASNIQDKDVILRVLSMYKDPQERERQIRNLSVAFQDLAGAVLPELRRARLTVNYELIGRDDEQIQQQYAADPSKLSAEELLYSATFDENYAKREEIYKKAAQLYPNDYRPLNNLAALAFSKGNEAEAQAYIEKALRVNPNAAEAYANKGIIALKNGNLTEAENLLGRGINANGYSEAAGHLNIAKGNYAQAERDFGDKATNSAALAQLLNQNYEKAIETLDRVKQPDAMTAYLHAVVAARRGNKYATQSYLKEALQMDPSLKEYADGDLEFQFLK